MTENMQADVALSRKAVFVRWSLYTDDCTICSCVSYDGKKDDIT